MAYVQMKMPSRTSHSKGAWHYNPKQSPQTSPRTPEALAANSLKHPGGHRMDFVNSFVSRHAQEGQKRSSKMTRKRQSRSSYRRELQMPCTVDEEMDSSPSISPLSKLEISLERARNTKFRALQVSQNSNGSAQLPPEARLIKRELTQTIHELVHLRNQVFCQLSMIVVPYHLIKTFPLLSVFTCS